MPIKLLVTHAEDEGSPDEYVFDQDTVTIGRDGDNHLTLPDPARIVSKRHAEVRDTGGGYLLADLGSKNFTFLNGNRLPSDQPARLSPGDRFTVGDFELRFYPEAAPSPNDDRTVFAASFVNPFEEAAEKLAASLGDLRRVWSAEAGAHRADALRTALGAALVGGEEEDEPGAVVAALLGGSGEEVGAQRAPLAPPPAAPPPTPTPPADLLAPDPAVSPFAVTQLEPVAVPAAPPAEAAPPATEPSRTGPPATGLPAAGRPAPGAAPAGQVERVLDVLTDVASRLLAIPWQFRHEFIGQTIVQTEETALLYETSPSELKALLLDARDPAEAERRMEAVLDAAEAVVVHQLALLDGYKASVQEGAGRLLGQVDPVALEEEIEASSPVYKVPQLRGVAVLDRLKEIHQELGGEDWSVAERRAFRPAFINAYLARMTRRRA